MQHLKDKAKSGIYWSVFDSFFLKGLLFVVQLILAKKLGPSVFGMMGMITIIINLGSLIIDSGLGASLIRTEDADEGDYNTVFYTNLLFAILLYGIFYLLAPLFALFYQEPQLIAIIRIYSLGFIISSMNLVQLAQLNKKMAFKKIALFNIAGTIAGIVIGLLMCYNGYGIWSLVYLYLGTQSVSTLIYYAFSKWRPQLLFSKTKFKHHLNFGLKLVCSGILDIFFKNIYFVIIGRFFPVKMLGYYERANTYNQYPVSTLSGIISTVSYPLLASIKNDSERVAEVYRLILKSSFFVTAPVMVCLAALAPELFSFVLGTQWMPAVPFFQIICISSILYPLQVFNVNILKVYGQSGLFLKLEIIKKVFLLVTVVVTYPFGIYVFVGSSIINAIIGYLLNSHYCGKFINYKTKEQIMDLMPTLICCAVLFVSIELFKNLTFHFSAGSSIIASIMIGIVVYILAHHISKSSIYQYLLKSYVS